MTVTDFSIHFDKETYQAGEMVTGQVVVIIAEKAKSLKKIDLKLVGRCKFHWMETESYRDNEGNTQHNEKKCEGKETYFKSEITLIKDLINNELTIGKHVYPFSVMIPSIAPSTFSGKYGGIQYYAKVKMEIPWKVDKHVKNFFHVVNILNLSNFPECNSPVKIEKNKNFCCCCCASGPLTIVACLPQSGFAKYESIPITVEVDNASNVKVNSIKARLLKRTCWRAESRVREDKDEIKSINMGSVEVNTSKTFNERMNLGSEQFPNINSCSIITLKYKLEVEADAEGMHSDLEIDIPLVIGDIGFNYAENVVLTPPQGVPLNYPPYGFNQPPLNPTAPYLETMVPLLPSNTSFSPDSLGSYPSSPPAFNPSAINVAPHLPTNPAPYPSLNVNDVSVSFTSGGNVN